MAGLSSPKSEDHGALSIFGNVGVTIKLARRKAGWTSAELARRAQIGKSQLSRYELGRDLPKLESLARILDSLGLDPLTFFCWTNRLARQMSREEVALEMLSARVEHDGASASFVRILEGVLGAYRSYVEALTGAENRKQEGYENE